MSTTRHLIVNADDFGQSYGVNRGIIECFENGIVTSASLMVRWPAAVEAAAYGRAHAELSVGLHLDLAEWAYDNDRWLPLYEVVPMDDHAAVAAEVARQLDHFRALLGKNPAHLDSHQHVHLREPVRSIMQKLSRDLGVPLRHHDARIRYCGEFYGQSGKGESYPDGVSRSRLLAILADLPPGITELGCHPGWAGDLASMYRAERTIELETLCDVQVRSFVKAAAIELCSFHDVTLAASLHTSKKH